MFKRYYTYILTNKYNEVLYIGVTNDLARRVAEVTLYLSDTFFRRSSNLATITTCKH